MIEKPTSVERTVDIDEEMRKHGVEIIKSEPVYPLPLAWEGLETLPEEQRANLRLFLEVLHLSSSRYANGILMRDSFGNDHKSRRQPWRKSMSEEFGDEFDAYDEANKLRFNIIYGVADSLRSTVKALNNFDIHTPQAEVLRSLEEKVPTMSASQYLTLSDEEKMQVVNSIDQIAREALGILANAGKIDERRT